MGGLLLTAATMKLIQNWTESGKEATELCQEGANRLREYARSYASTVRGNPGPNAQGNQDGEAYLQHLMQVAKTTHEDAIQMCKESDQHYEQNAWKALLPGMREAVTKGYLAKHSDNPTFRIVLSEFLGDDTHY